MSSNNRMNFHFHTTDTGEGFMSNATYIVFDNIDKPQMETLPQLFTEALHRSHGGRQPRLLINSE